MDNVYLSNFPRESMRACAGFRAEGASFFLPRAVNVPEDLQRMIFPDIEKW